MDNEKRRVGRPRSRSDEGPGDYIGIRAPRELKERLEVAALAAKRSLSTEAQFRLEWSFAETAYPPEIAALAELIARAMDETGKRICTPNQIAGNAPVHWFDDPYAFDQAIKAARRLLVQSRPTGDRKPHGLWARFKGLPDGVGPGDDIADRVGKRIADGILESIRGRQPGIYRWTLARSIRERLGSIGERLAPSKDVPPLPDRIIS